ncbi:hypothetical protein BDZ90DRAFT_262330 [Jaminaea rosea]|uniref:Uncharacterized protein n=1 Tax=Jaminaea rosea TaxID=1569628 RepID=A0A316UJ79_9BASI|nr:hypothetical protein BDZ90DRAFT_262330 [Jaminaea rosea]PWN25269.1 hypothetical protein BDZ90DRAFT_262330 [Jaminaea rosea]
MQPRTRIKRHHADFLAQNTTSSSQASSSPPTKALCPDPRILPEVLNASAVVTATTVTTTTTTTPYSLPHSSSSRIRTGARILPAEATDEGKSLPEDQSPLNTIATAGSSRRAAHQPGANAKVKHPVAKEVVANAPSAERSQSPVAAATADAAQSPANRPDVAPPACPSSTHPNPGPRISSAAYEETKIYPLHGSTESPEAYCRRHIRTMQEMPTNGHGACAAIGAALEMDAMEVRGKFSRAMKYTNVRARFPDISDERWTAIRQRFLPDEVPEGFEKSCGPEHAINSHCLRIIAQIERCPIAMYSDQGAAKSVTTASRQCPRRTSRQNATLRAMSSNTNTCALSVTATAGSMQSPINWGSR